MAEAEGRGSGGAVARRGTSGGSRGGDGGGGGAAAAIASRGGVVIQPENYILNLDSGRSVDVDVLAEYGGADIDIGFMPAKYRVSRPAAGGRKDENDTVNVYPSGKIVCLGARSVEKAQNDVKMVLRRLGVATAVDREWTTETEEAEAVMHGVDSDDDGGDGDAKDLAKVRYVVASGCIFGAYDIYKAIPLLEDRYEVTLDSEVFSGYFVRSREGGGVSVQVFAHQAGGGGGGARTPLLCRGPTMRDVQTVVGDVYRMIVKANEGDMAGDGGSSNAGDAGDAGVVIK